MINFFNIGNVKEALLLTNELLQIVPFHQRALGNKRHYEDVLRKEGLLLPVGPLQEKSEEYVCSSYYFNFFDFF